MDRTELLALLHHAQEVGWTDPSVDLAALERRLTAAAEESDETLAADASSFAAAFLTTPEGEAYQRLTGFDPAKALGKEVSRFGSGASTFAFGPAGDLILALLALTPQEIQLLAEAIILAGARWEEFSEDHPAMDIGEFRWFSATIKVALANRMGEPGQTQFALQPRSATVAGALLRFASKHFGDTVKQARAEELLIPVDDLVSASPEPVTIAKPTKPRTSDDDVEEMALEFVRMDAADAIEWLDCLIETPPFELIDHLEHLRLLRVLLEKTARLRVRTFETIEAAGRVLQIMERIERSVGQPDDIVTGRPDEGVRYTPQDIVRAVIVHLECFLEDPRERARQWLSQTLPTPPPPKKPGPVNHRPEGIPGARTWTDALAMWRGLASPVRLVSSPHLMVRGAVTLVGQVSGEEDTDQSPAAKRKPPTRKSAAPFPSPTFRSPATNPAVSPFRLPVGR